MSCLWCSLELSLIVTTSVFATSILSGVFGMAGGLILMGVLAAIMPVTMAMTFHGFAQLIANGTRALSLWRHISWRSWLVFAMGSALSGLLFWSIVFVPSHLVLFFSLGCIPFIGLSRWTPALDFERPWHAFFCGFVSTAAHLSAGVSGPIVDLFFVRAKMDRFRMIGTKAATQVLGHGLKIAYFGTLLRGTSDSERFEMHWWLPPAIAFSAIGGTFIGGMILRKLSEASFRMNLRRLFLVIGTSYLLRGLWELFDR